MEADRNDLNPSNETNIPDVEGLIQVNPQIKNLRHKKLVGMRMSMSLLLNTTAVLWQSFMRRRNEIHNSEGTDLYSLQVYDSRYFEEFDAANTFEKWATLEVSEFDNVPDGFETLVLNPGLYVVFHYRGTSANAGKTFQYIFTTWLPQSPYKLDDRPHFEILGEKYKREDPESEEEIWIPIAPKN